MRPFWIPLLGGLLGCEIDGYRCEPQPAMWSLAVTGSFPVALGTHALALVQRSGSFVDTCPGTGLVEIDENGAITRSRCVSPEFVGGQLSVSDDGELAVRLETVPETLLRLDSALEQRWTRTVQSFFAFAAGPGGATAYAKLDPNGLDGPELVYVDAAGNNQWSLPVSYPILQLRVLASGEVVVRTESALQRFSTTGMLVESSRLDASGLPRGLDFTINHQLASDGSLLATSLPEGDAVIRWNNRGTLMWVAPTTSPTSYATLTDSGHVMITTGSDTQIGRLDASTGELVGLHDNCQAPGEPRDRVVWADSDSYVLWLPSTPSVIARYAGP